MIPDDEPDSLSDLFRGLELPPSDAGRREAIFARTRGVLQRRRVLRRCAKVAVLATCYVAGGLSVVAWQSMESPDRIVGQPARVIEEQGPTPAQEPTGPSDPNSADEPSATIARSEPAASLTNFEKLRRAGDRQLNERGNLQAAMRCYRRALEYASDDDLQIVPDRDTWLLIPLKEARMETRKHVRKKI